MSREGIGLPMAPWLPVRPLRPRHMSGYLTLLNLSENNIGPNLHMV